jgi:transcriptional regulator with XRE-family HTH domain
MGRGNGITPPEVVETIKELVSKHGQAGTARATGLVLRTVQNYLRGIGEPTRANLQKLANYTGKTFDFKVVPER